MNLTVATDRLASFDTCTVSDALDSLGLHGSVSTLASVGLRRRLVGCVRTVRLAAVVSAPDASSSPSHLGVRAIESSSPGDVIVIQQAAGVQAASWGGLLMTAAKARGVAGIVTNGRVRDVADTMHLNFPVYAHGATPLTARGRVIEVATDETVEIEGVAVRPGDYVLADANGVVFVPAVDVGRVLHAAEQTAIREKAMRAALSSGTPPSQVLGAAYEGMLRR